MFPTDLRRAGRSASLVLVALVVGAGSTAGSDALDQPISPLARADWLEDHFAIEHAGELVQSVAIDPPTRTVWLEDHFAMEHAAEMVRWVAVDSDSQTATHDYVWDGRLANSYTP